MEADEVDVLFMIGAMFSKRETEETQKEALKAKARAMR